MAIEHLKESERSQVVEILRELGVSTVVTLQTVLHYAPWLHPQRVSASLYSLYKAGDLELSDIKGERNSNQYIILESINEEHDKRASTVGWTKSRTAIAFESDVASPEEDTVSPKAKSDTSDMLIEAAVLIEGNYLNDALEAIRASYFKLKKAIEER